MYAPSSKSNLFAPHDVLAAVDPVCSSVSFHYRSTDIESCIEVSYREISVNEFVKTIGWTDSLPALFDLIHSQHVPITFVISPVAVVGR